MHCASLHIGAGGAWPQLSHPCWHIGPYTSPSDDLAIGNGFGFGNDNAIGFGDCGSFGVAIGNGIGFGIDSVLVGKGIGIN